MAVPLADAPSTRSTLLGPRRMTGHDRPIPRSRPATARRRRRRQPPQRLRAGERGVVRRVRPGARRPRRARSTASSTMIDAARRCRSATGPCSNNRSTTSTRVARAHPRRSTTRAPATPFLLDSAWPTPDLAPHRLRAHGPSAAHGAARGRAVPAAAARAAHRRASTTTATAFDYERTLIDGYPAPMLQPMTEVTIVTPRRARRAGLAALRRLRRRRAGRGGLGLRRRPARARRQHRDARRRARSRATASRSPPRRSRSTRRSRRR